MSRTRQSSIPFVQFYPELLEIARAKETIKPGVRLAEVNLTRAPWSHP